MKMNRVLLGAMASLLALGMAAPAFADHDRGRGHDRDRREWRHDSRHHGRDYDRDRRYHGGRYHHRPGPPPRVVYRPVPGPGYGWKVGHRYRDYYRGPIYVVNDYPHYHLRRPPHGHHWVRDDRGNMLLVAVATGIIADIVLHH